MDNTPQWALDAQQVSHRYGSQAALEDLDLQVRPGEIFALLGPNGSGKTTLFRLISTLARLQQGEICVYGQSVRTAMAAVRGSLGVVFQSPSLDPKLTVSENIDCQAALYGLRGARLQQRKSRVVEQLGLQERLKTPTEQLSGGLKRRVELAKVLLHRPRLLLMDEPSTGLDPASRLDLWHALSALREESEATVLLTTHLLEEADKADRIAILHRGQTVALGQPATLRSSLGEQVLSIQTSEQAEVLAWLEQQRVEAQQIDGQLRVAGTQAAALVAPLATAFGSRIQSLTLGQPSLEDVFVARTGHRFLSPSTT
ncbi:MAG: ABC transporter ATP-binding protein [Planctomycetales bacterium]|nr:ABC transporter ATP-binding protein [Planctomycetales bacterium]